MMAVAPTVMEGTVAKVQRLKPEPMTAESFAPFGELWHAPGPPGDEAEIVPVGFTYQGKATVSVIRQPHVGLAFTELERHFGVTQGFAQLSGSPSVVCVARPSATDDPADIPDPADVRAFLIDPAVGYAFRRGTWHSLNRYSLDPSGGTFLILNSDPNPTQIVDYRTGAASIYRDLGADMAPEKIDLAGDFGVIFEIDA